MIVYLHGFRSSPQSSKAQRLKARMAALGLGDLFWCGQLPPSPRAAIALAERQIAAARAPGAPVTVVGSSLGGYYATHLAERYGARAVLINPTTRPYDDLQSSRGVQTNLYTGAAFEVTDAHFAELSALAVPRITRPERYFLLVETGDEVLDWRLAVAHYAGAWQYVRGGGDHSFTDFVAQLPAILRFAGVAVAPSAAWLPEPADLPGDRQRAEPLQGHVR